MSTGDMPRCGICGAWLFPTDGPPHMCQASTLPTTYALSEIDRLKARLAEAERNEETLLGMIHHQRDVLRECLPYINESMAGRRPGRCADDIRAAVKALTADRGDERTRRYFEVDEICCLDYPRCDCNSPPEPDNEWHCSQYPGCECFAGCREKALEAAP